MSFALEQDVQRSAVEAPRNKREQTGAGVLTYIRFVWHEYICVMILALLSLAVYFTPVYHDDQRLFAVSQPSTPDFGTAFTDPAYIFQGDSLLAYPITRSPLPSWACGLVSILVPIVVIAMFQIKLRSLWDFHAGVIGVLNAVVFTTFICTVLKHFNGGFRPYFKETCKINADRMLGDINEGRLWHNITVCEKSAKELSWAMQGFPSGHAACAFAGAVFLTLYMNAKLKTFSDHASHTGLMFLVVVPLLCASLVGGAMYVTYQHHAHEVIFGSILGLVVGTLSYRSIYAAVFDFRFNHIPLPPVHARTRFSYNHNAPHIVASSHPDDLPETDNHMVVWSWWKHSEPSEDEQKREVAWLRSIQSINVTGREMAHQSAERKPPISLTTLLSLSRTE